jgi:hypothetical protein
VIGRWTKATDPIRSFSHDLAQHAGIGRRYVGTVTVPVDQIGGSVGRSHELGSDFLPLRKTFGFSRDTARYRWVRQAMAQPGVCDFDDMHRITGRYHSHGEYEAKRGVTLPPIELYKLGSVYYVVDGHHRVAAARSLGQVAMEAVVTEYIPAPAVQSQTEAA